MKASVLNAVGDEFEASNKRTAKMAAYFERKRVYIELAHERLRHFEQKIFTLKVTIIALKLDLKKANTVEQRVRAEVLLERAEEDLVEAEDGVARQRNLLFPLP